MVRDRIPNANAGGFKQIVVRMETWTRLDRLRKGGDSFNDVILRLLNGGGEKA